MAKPFNARTFLQARGFLRNYATYKIWAEMGIGLKAPAKLSTVFSGTIDEPIIVEDREVWSGTWQEIRKDCVDLELIASVASIDKMLAYLNEPGATCNPYWEMGSELEGRLLDELKNRMFLSLSLRETEDFRQPRKGWETIIERFPAAVLDIEEAKKCFALSRYAAAVFHSLQITEFGLIALGELLGVNDPQPGWAATSNALKGIIQKKYSDRNAFERDHFPFIEQMQATVEALKNAWRNKVSHAHGKLTVMTADFSPDVAEDILSATRAFMRRLATDAPWPKEQPS
jgi:hypothetical protein